jgi:hypothetical protein
MVRPAVGNILYHVHCLSVYFVSSVQRQQLLVSEGAGVCSEGTSTAPCLVACGGSVSIAASGRGGALGSHMWTCWHVAGCDCSSTLRCCTRTRTWTGSTKICAGLFVRRCMQRISSFRYSFAVRVVLVREGTCCRNACGRASHHPLYLVRQALKQTVVGTMSVSRLSVRNQQCCGQRVL